MKPRGWNSRIRASLSLPAAASLRVSPMSPSNMLARCTSGNVPPRLGDCFLDQTFFQPDAQIAGHDLDDVLGFQRRA